MGHLGRLYYVWCCVDVATYLEIIGIEKYVIVNLNILLILSFRDPLLFDVLNIKGINEKVRGK